MHKNAYFNNEVLRIIQTKMCVYNLIYLNYNTNQIFDIGNRYNL